jgi:hypothetical protein
LIAGLVSDGRVGKAEHLSRGVNPRFVVTNIPQDEIAAGIPKCQLRARIKR